MTTVSVSFYEALATRLYRDEDNVLRIFDLSEFLELQKQTGVREMRMFAELNFMLKGKPFNAAHAVKPFRTKGNTWEFNGPLGSEWLERIRTAVKIGRKKPTLRYQLCYQTQGPKYGDPFFAKMGYPLAEQRYVLADTNPSAFSKLKAYCSLITEELQKYKERFKYAELYNEQQIWHSSKDEYDGCAPRKSEFPMLQWNCQWLGFSDIEIAEIKRIVRDLRGIGKPLKWRIRRFSFHSVFTPADVINIVLFCQKVDIPRAEIVVSTDGGTPCKKQGGGYVFTQENHSQHFNQRRELYEQKFDYVLGAHEDIKNEAVKQKVAVVDFQSVLKWSQNPVVLLFDDKVGQFNERLTA